MLGEHQPPWFLSFDTQFESNTFCKLHDSWYYLYVGFLRYFWQWIPAGLIFVILSPACWCPPVGLPKWPGLQMASLASTWVSRTQRFLQCLSQLLCGPIKTKSDDLEKESLDPLDMNEFKSLSTFASPALSRNLHWDSIEVDFSGHRAELTNEFEDRKLCIACKAGISSSIHHVLNTDRQTRLKEASKFLRRI